MVRPAGAAYSGGMKNTNSQDDLTILLVEDNPTFAHAVQQYLSLIDHVKVVGHAMNGPQAISMTLTLRPDLLLLDISLGGMSGFDIARHVAELTHRPRIIFLTMHDQPAYREQAKQLGAQGYVLKDEFVQQLPPMLETLAGNRPQFV